MELQHGDNFLDHLDSLITNHATGLGMILKNLTAGQSQAKPFSLTNTMVPADVYTTIPKAQSFPPSSIYDIKAALVQNAAKNPPVPVGPMNSADMGERLGAMTEAASNVEKEVAQNIKTNNIFEQLKNGASLGSMSMGAVIPPYLDEIIRRAKDQQFKNEGGT